MGIEEMSAWLAAHSCERTRCEVWSRVMGYHRPVSQWNPGKQQEYRDRKRFVESVGLERCNREEVSG
jgi:anaerobic ribonucleoside-triphosphate reductase